jgi:hypothetical protein
MNAAKTKDLPTAVHGMAQRIRAAWQCLVGNVTVDRVAAPKRGYRRELPPCRDCQHISFRHDGFDWTASVGFYDDGSIGEVFLTNTKSGSNVEAAAQDACVAASIAIQYGAPLKVIASGLSRDSRGIPQCAIGVAMDILVSESKKS